MLYREIIAVCSEIQTRHINALCGKNVEFLNVKPRGRQSNQEVLWGKGLILQPSTQKKGTSPKMSRVQRTVKDDVPGTYAEGNEFECRPVHTTNEPEIFSGFRLSFQAGKYVKLGHHLFSPHSFEFISHQSFHGTLCSLRSSQLR